MCGHAQGSPGSSTAHHHAGGFPWAAIQGPLAPPVFPFDVPAGEFLVAEIKQGGAPLGYVTDGGKFRKRR